jgi:hypothetical protein
MRKSSFEDEVLDEDFELDFSSELELDSLELLESSESDF